MPIELRAPRPDETSALAALARAGLPEAWSEAGFAETLARRDVCALVAYRGPVAAPDAERALGFALAVCAADQAELLVLTVEPAARRQGIGRQLVAALCERLRAAGARKLFLEVRASNAAARALYSQTGFSAEGLRACYYADGEDALILGAAL